MKRVLKWYHAVVKDATLLGKPYWDGMSVYYAKDGDDWLVYVGFGLAVVRLTLEEAKQSILITRTSERKPRLARYQANINTGYALYLEQKARTPA